MNMEGAIANYLWAVERGYYNLAKMVILQDRLDPPDSVFREYPQFKEFWAEKCPICLRFQKQDCYYTACGHLFCRDCLRQWVKMHRSRTCPLCRSNL
jgi:hypothetical protein